MVARDLADVPGIRDDPGADWYPGFFDDENESRAWDDRRRTTLTVADDDTLREIFTRDGRRREVTFQLGGPANARNEAATAASFCLRAPACPGRGSSPNGVFTAPPHPVRPLRQRVMRLPHGPNLTRP